MSVVFQEVSQRLVNLSAQLHALQVCVHCKIHVTYSFSADGVQNEPSLRPKSHALVGCGDTTGLHLRAQPTRELCLPGHPRGPYGPLPVPGWSE